MKMNGAVSVTLSVMVMTAVMFNRGAQAGGSQGYEDSSASSESNGPRSVGPMLSKEACRCSTKSRYGVISTNYCTGRTGQLSIGCSESNAFLQCNNAVCSIQACPLGTVWDASTSTCVACPAGTHVNARNNRCVCNMGTTWNSTSLQCVACPTGATILPDACACSRYMIVNRTTNACVTCPATAYYTENTCRCSDATLFFNSATGTCDKCPGAQVQVSAFQSVCRCSGNVNIIFDRQSVSCFTCPAGTTAILSYKSNQGDFCNCNMYGAKFNRITGACTCPIGQTANTVRNVCEYTPVVVPVPPAVVPPVVQP